VLSVAGLLAITGRFPGWRGFILRVKREVFLRAEALLFNLTGITVVHPVYQPSSTH